MYGKLEIYNPAKRLPCFISEPPASSTSNVGVIFIGGLTDNLLACDHLISLKERLFENFHWSLIQPFLSSSHIGYGINSLATDVEELDILIDYLQNRNPKMNRFILIGYSTGCQDSVLFLKMARNANKIVATVMQSPVSDREFMATLAETESMINLSTEMIQRGQANELMPINATIVPITAYRYHSLAARGGDDDYFSSDLSQEELVSKLGHIKCPTAIVYGTADEYIPRQVDIRNLAAKLDSAMVGIVRGDTSIQIKFIEGANHAFSEPAHIAEFVDFCSTFFEQLNLTASH